MRNAFLVCASASTASHTPHDNALYILTCDTTIPVPSFAGEGLPLAFRTTGPKESPLKNDCHVNLSKDQAFQGFSLNVCFWTTRL